MRSVKRQRGQDKASALVPLVIESSPPSESTPLFELVLPGDRVLRVPAGFDAEALKRLLGVLEESAC
jgi:hypothetical protein